jgi:hypothetical protein
VEEGHLIDHAPTWMAVLDVEVPTAQGRVIRELINE